MGLAGAQQGNLAAPAAPRAAPGIPHSLFVLPKQLPYKENAQNPSSSTQELPSQAEKDFEGWLESGLKGNVQGLLWAFELKIPTDKGEVAQKGS
ncbi:hypothetical protein CB1_000195015 [Camelus ferus]|nr:hypothetical protein CB1_000195015 [Camelus ferus]